MPQQPLAAPGSVVLAASTPPAAVDSRITTCRRAPRCSSLPLTAGPLPAPCRCARGRLHKGGGRKPDTETVHKCRAPRGRKAGMRTFTRTFFSLEAASRTLESPIQMGSSTQSMASLNSRPCVAHCNRSASQPGGNTDSTQNRRTIIHLEAEHLLQIAHVAGVAGADDHARHLWVWMEGGQSERER